MIQDEKIIQSVLDGDIESFRLLVEKYEGPIFRIVSNISGGSQLCEDIAQDTLFTAYKKLKYYDSSRSSFSTWLFTIAKNKTINALKKKKPVYVDEISHGAQVSVEGQVLEEKEFFDLLDQALIRLPAKQKKAFVLVELEEMSYAQAAEIEKTREGTIKSRLSRAKEKLRSLLKEIDGKCYEK